MGCLRYCKSTIFQANHNAIGIRKHIHSVVCDTAKVRFFKQITTEMRKRRWNCCCLRYCKSTIFQANHNFLLELVVTLLLFAILQKYDFSSKSQQNTAHLPLPLGCLRYCKSTIFQANHNASVRWPICTSVVCDTAKVRFFKQITTATSSGNITAALFAILQKYDFSSKSQHIAYSSAVLCVVCDTAKVRFFKQITTGVRSRIYAELLFAILQKYDFSSKSQLHTQKDLAVHVVCDTAKVRFFKQITTLLVYCSCSCWLFAILQKYDFSSKSQRPLPLLVLECCCLRYCKSTIFQANHN